jgi:UDP-3-O-[3-hydroxymyristoyl] glucosamine N-acyltransferase
MALVAEGAAPVPGVEACILVARPRYALALLLELFVEPPRLAGGIHASAVIAPSARIAPTATIGPLCFVDADAMIGEGVRVLAQVTIGAGSRIGDESILHPGVRIGEHVQIGKRVTLYPNACIGADGFSFATAEPSGIDWARTAKSVQAETRAPRRIPSLGGVVIEDDVEVGAGATIDRATLGNTLVRRGTKIDNLVLVGHNSLIGEDCLIAGQSGISGSCLIGNRVAMGGQVGIADHIRVGDDVVLAATAGVSQHVPEKSLYIDTPAIPYARWQERYKAIGRLTRLMQEVRRLGERVRLLERAAAPAEEAPAGQPPSERAKGAPGR